MKPIEAFTMLYEDWPMNKSYREKAWQALRAAVEHPKVKQKASCSHVFKQSATHSIICGKCSKVFPLR